MRISGLTMILRTKNRSSSLRKTGEVVKKMTFGEALKHGTEYLQSCGIEEASVDAWFLLEYCCDMSRTRYLLCRTEQMEEEFRKRYRALLEQRGKHIPLQHITGEQEFMGLSFRVNDQVLIPRQDTEVLVEEAIKTAVPGMRVLDVCTGSGCIIISLVKLCPGLTGTALDLSPGALQVARENARRQGVSIEFIESDLFDKVQGTFDLIVSNPPYIPTAAIEQLMDEVRLHDPRMALDGKEDGLYFYREIVGESIRYLSPGGWLMFEIGSDQGEPVAEMLREKQFTGVKIIKDLAGLDRVVIGRKS